MRGRGRNRAPRPNEGRGYRSIPYPAPAPRVRNGGPVLVQPELLQDDILRTNDQILRVHSDNHQMLDEIARISREIPLVTDELNFISQSIPRLRADKELESRELIQKGLKLEAELRSLEPLKSEHTKLRRDLQRNDDLRKEMTDKVKEMTDELKDLKTQYQKKPVIIAEIDEHKKELNTASAALDFEKRAGAELAEQVQVMEKNLVSMAREAEQLRAQLERRSREPGLGSYSDHVYGGGTSYGSEYERMYNDPYGRLQLP